MSSLTESITTIAGGEASRIPRNAVQVLISTCYRGKSALWWEEEELGVLPCPKASRGVLPEVEVWQERPGKIVDLRAVGASTHSRHLRTG